MKSVLYTVKEGDSLANIAAKFHTAGAVVAARNNLKGELFEGMKLIIDEQEAFGYTVRPFDTVNGIAAKFGVSADKLRRLNSLEEVFVGQRILIPEDSKKE